MAQYDFSSGFNLLNQGINSLGEALGNRSDAEAYAGINDSLSQGTSAGYQQAMAKAMAAGKPDLALKIQSIALQYGQAGAAAAGFGGGGGAGAPAVPGDTTAATLKPPAAPGTEASITPATVKAGVAPGYEAVGLARPDVVAMIRQEAQARNIDPDVAVRVAETEGLNNYTGDKGKSFGPYQLYTGGGLGNVFQQKTGLDPSDPRTLRQQIQFALDTAASQGSWHGWNGPKNAGMNMAAGLQNARPIGVGLQGRAGGPSAAGPVSAIDVPPGTPNQPGAGVPSVAGAQTPPTVPQPPSLRSVQPAAAGIPLNAPERGVDAIARWLGTHLPGAPTPEQQAAAAANPPGFGGFSLGSLLGARPPQAAPAAPQGPGPGQNIPAAYGQPQPPTPVEAPLPPVRPADLGAPPQGPGQNIPAAYGQPPAPAPPAAPPAPQGPQSPADMAAVFAERARQRQAFIDAQTPPQSPVPQPPADMAAVFAERERQRRAFIDAQSAQGAAKDVPPEHTPAPVPPALQPKSAANAPVEAPLPPRRPAELGAPRIPVDYGRPAAPDQPPPLPPRRPSSFALDQPPTRPAALAPRGPAQGPWGPPGGPDSAFARDFGPGRGQMWGPQGGVIAAPGGVGPSQGPAPPGQPSILGPNASPYAQAALAAIQAGRRPGAPGVGGMPQLGGGPGGPAPGPGAMPAALPPGAPPGAPAAGGGLGARLGGLGSGLINLLSLQPPGGIPGMPTAASYAQGRPTPPGGWGAPVPGGGGLPMAPGLPPAALAAAGAPAAPAAPMLMNPNATPAEAAVHAQNVTQSPGFSALPLEQQRDRMRAGAAWYGSLGNTGAAKPYLDAADALDKRIAEQEKQASAAGYKTGEISAQAKADMAKDDYKAISANADTIRGPSGPLGLIKSVTEMKKQFDDLQDAGWGATGLGNLQGTWDKALGVLGIFDQNAGRAASGQQEFNSLKAQELAQLATTLYANGHGRLNRQEFMALKEGNYDLKFRPDAVRAMLDYAEERGHMALDAYNRQIENFPRVHKGFMSADELDPLKVTQKERQAATTYTWAPRAPTQGQGSSAQSPTPVTTPQDAAKLPVGTWITVPGKPAPTQITQAFKDRYATPAAPAEAGAAP